MLSKISITIGIVFALIFGISGSIRHEAALHALEISPSGAVLYYNSPTAIRIADDIFVGWAENDGSIRVSRLQRSSGIPQYTSIIHWFEGPDDHAAPALIISDGVLWVATAHHSSDVYVYRADDTEAGEFRLACHLKGAYSYPRLFEVGPTVQLLVRTEDESLPLKRGGLALVDITREGCSPASVIAMPEQSGDWIYAVPPHVNGDIIRTAWSLYNLDSKRHTGLYVASIKDGRVIDTKQLEKRNTPHELITWSIDKETISVSAFTGAFKCCAVSSIQRLIYSHSGKIIDKDEPTVAPYYPSFDVGRRPRQCAIKGIASMRLPVLGDPRSFIWMEFDKTFHLRDFQGSRVKLCIVGE